MFLHKKYPLFVLVEFLMLEHSLNSMHLVVPEKQTQQPIKKKTKFLAGSNPVPSTCFSKRQTNQPSLLPESTTIYYQNTKNFKK